MQNLSPLSNISLNLSSLIKPSKTKETRSVNMNNDIADSFTLSKFVKKHKKISYAILGAGALLGTFLGIKKGAVAYDKKANLQRICVVEKDNFSAKRTINGKTYTIFGNNEYLNQFIKGLEENKAILMESLDISESDYALFTQLALILADVETNSGEQHKENYLLRKIVKLGNTPSAGLTNLKVDENDVRYAKFGIDGGYDIHNDPYKAAIATIIKLDFLKNNQYPKYLRTLKMEPYASLPQERKLNFIDYCFVRWKGKSCIDRGKNSFGAKIIDAILRVKNGETTKSKEPTPLNIFEREYSCFYTRLQKCL